MATNAGPTIHVAPAGGPQQIVLSPEAALALRNDGIDINTVPILAIVDPQPQPQSVDDLAQCECVLFGARLAAIGLLPGLIACLVIRTCAWKSWRDDRADFLRKRTVVVFTPYVQLIQTQLRALSYLLLRNFLGPEIWASRSATYQEITGTINLPVDTSCCCNDYATQQFHINTNPPRQSGALIDLRLHVKDVVEAHMQAAITYCQTCTQTGAPIDSGRLQALLTGQQ